jgi:hypothetical protein
MLKALIIGTGPSLKSQIADIYRLKEKGFKVFGVNNTYKDIPLDCWIACDPQWHQIYSPVEGDFDRWHWDKSICEKYGYQYIEGRWSYDNEKGKGNYGLSADPKFIHYGHASSYQALGIAVHYGATEFYLCGHDMRYSGQRHYFANLSEDAGEYPKPLRKHSAFDGLIKQYETITRFNPSLKIYNCTKDSDLTCFPYKDLGEL